MVQIGDCLMLGHPSATTCLVSRGAASQIPTILGEEVHWKKSSTWGAFFIAAIAGLPGFLALGDNTSWRVRLTLLSLRESVQEPLARWGRGKL